MNGRQAGHIVTLDVDPAERRRGLGTLLMQTAEEQMKQEGAGVMSLEVAENNAAARQFYRGLGFVTRGRICEILWGEGRCRGYGEGDLIRAVIRAILCSQTL